MVGFVAAPNGINSNLNWLLRRRKQKDDRRLLHNPCAGSDGAESRLVLR